jgi:hypothetical protein
VDQNLRERDVGGYGGPRSSEGGAGSACASRFYGPATDGSQQGLRRPRRGDIVFGRSAGVFALEGSSATIPDSGLAWRKSCAPGAGEFQGAASQFVMRRYHDVHDEARVGRECD